MNYIFRSECLQHQTGNHPERAERLSAFKHLPDSSIPSGEEYLQLVHTADYIKKVKDACAHSIPLDGDTLTSTQSYTAACAAVGASILAAETNGFALIRPPGHHAYPDRASGFCLFNSIAIATRHLTQQGKKVMLLDFDGHLGDGTSDIFYRDPNVLFCSLHQFPAFPGNGWIDEIGSGSGKGFTVNLPLPPGSADDIFWKGMDFLQPIVENFKPEIVAVSAGFDAHHSDPLLQLNLSLNSYYRCGTWLNDQFENVFAVLEGGYHLDTLPKAINQFYCGINQLDEPYPETSTSSDITIRTVFDRNIEGLQEKLRDYWPL